VVRHCEHRSAHCLSCRTVASQLNRPDKRTDQLQSIHAFSVGADVIEDQPTDSRLSADFPLTLRWLRLSDYERIRMDAMSNMTQIINPLQTVEPTSH
jgi:hypothetical protein